MANERKRFRAFGRCRPSQMGIAVRGELNVAGSMNFGEGKLTRYGHTIREAATGQLHDTSFVSSDDVSGTYLGVI
jgi:hypothetical protein